ncbi:fragment of stage 0 sporulation protein A [Candidatus Desulfosporosinus infrequens]|uniref:Fragment of stage 0 sporulation protein A n=1 Tax=Candidatus Desulfosporosinus infrequens TaxID=2043169 RepID=A0A2U3KN22_9FIRM|nr:fragment of stage 0 sporulation protein A [Candidatus Desulfosporosinus infrequens]
MERINARTKMKHPKIIMLTVFGQESIINSETDRGKYCRGFDTKDD